MIYQNYTKEDIGEAIKRHRQKRGWTQGQLRIKTGLSTSAINQAEHGIRMPHLSTILKICSAFGITVDELLGVKAPTAATPKKVIQFDGHLARCQNCRRIVTFSKDPRVIDNYCPKCGQRLKWE